MCKQQDRRAFTLLELLVVMGVMAALFALTAVYFATFGKSQSVQSGADQLTGWLVSARQLAKRDGLATGLRFYPDPNNPTSFFTQVQYIQQPDDFAVGSYVGALPAVANGPNIIARIQSQMIITSPTPYPRGDPTQTFSFVDLTDPKAFPVQVGDYLELYGSGVLRQIVSLPVLENNVPTQGPFGVYRFNVANPPPLGNGVALPSSPNANLPPTYPTTSNPANPELPYVIDLKGNKYYDMRVQNYRIIPAPRPINGEPVQNLPDNVVIDFTTQAWNIPYSANGPNGPGSLSNLPIRVDALGNKFYEILFSPSGAVVGQGTTTQIFLWVCGLPRDNSVDRLAGRPTLVTVQPLSGFISQQRVPAAGDPYSFAKDGLSSGM